MEASPATQAVLAPAPVQLLVVRERPGRMTLWWALPLGLLGPGFVLLAVGGLLRSEPVQVVSLALMGSCFVLSFVLAGLYPKAGLVLLGTLTAQADGLLWELHGESPRLVPLTPDGPPLTIWYAGYQDEGNSSYRMSGYDNFLALGEGPRHQLWLRDKHAVRHLRAVLHSWYHRRVPIKEYYRNRPTFLLAGTFSREQIRAYEQEFGMQLSK